MPSQTSTGWIKVLMTLGAIMSVFFFVAPLLIQMTMAREAQRYLDCTEGTRKDCEPSFAWMLFERTDGLPEMDEEMSTIEAEGDSMDDRLVRASGTAPLILSVEPQGMMMEAGWYRAKAGTKVTMNVEVVDATKVELYVIPKGTETAGMAQKIATLSKQAGEGTANSSLYSGSFTVQSGWLADLEVRATNAQGETAALTLDVGAL
jgi:hypothetical protein